MNGIWRVDREGYRARVAAAQNTLASCWRAGVQPANAWEDFARPLFHEFNESAHAMTHVARDEGEVLELQMQSDWGNGVSRVLGRWGGGKDEDGGGGS